MKQSKKIILTLLLVLTMVSQCIGTYAKSSVVSEDIPSEVLNAPPPYWVNESFNYVRVPVKYKGKERTAITVKLQKTGNLSHISGYATFYIKAYVYQSKNEENIKVGAQVIYQSVDGEWVVNDIRDRIEQLGNTKNAKDKIGWPDCSGYYITLLDPVEFTMLNQNEQETRVKILLKGKNGGSFERSTDKNVKLSPTNPEEENLSKDLNVKITTLSSSGNKVAEDGFKLEGEWTDKGDKEHPIVVDARSKAEIYIKGVNINAKQYQFIKTDTAPTALPTTGWKDLDDAPLDPITKEQVYPDVMWGKNGYISTKHYNYKYGDKTTTDTVPARQDTFKYPIGDNLVIQKATVDSSDTRYYSTAEKTKDEAAAAFYENSYIHKNSSGSNSFEDNLGIGGYKPGVFDGLFIPEESGDYQFSVYSNIGSYVSMMVEGRKRELVTGKKQQNKAYYNSTGESISLKAGEAYPIHMELLHKETNHVTPSLHYRIKNNKKSNNNEWRLVPANLFEDEKYVHGGDKAVKFWGYIIPTESGTYQLGAYSDDGAYGYIVSKGEKIEFVENWVNQQAFNRTNGRDITLEEEVVYPIYMEWYEGKPTEKAFIPIYKKKGSSFKAIPKNWFYPSANEEPGKVNTAYFDVPHEKTSTVLLPQEEGTYYLALQITNQEDLGNDDKTVRKVIYGPFEIKSIKPIITNKQPSKNYINPEGLSSVVYEFGFNEYSKDIECRIDLLEIINAKLKDGTPFIESDFDINRIKKMFSIKQIEPGIQEVNQGISNDYIVSKVGNEVVVTFNNDFEAEQGAKFELAFYVPTHLRNQISYKRYEDECIMDTEFMPIKISAKVSAIPRLSEREENSDGTVKEAVWGSKASEEGDVVLRYVPMSKIK